MRSHNELGFGNEAGYAGTPQQVLDAYASESGEGDHRTPGEGSDSVSGSAASDLTGARRG